MGVARQVDQQVAKHAVDQPGRDLSDSRDLMVDFLECDLQFVDRILPPFVDTRSLASRTHEQSAEQVAQRGMIEPIHYQLRNRSGRRKNGLSAGVAPPITTWLPPPVPE